MGQQSGDLEGCRGERESDHLRWMGGREEGYGCVCVCVRTKLLNTGKVKPESLAVEHQLHISGFGSKMCSKLISIRSLTVGQ